MNTMQATARQPQALVSTGVRVATAFAVVACLGAAWLGTQHESREAVQLSAAAMGPRPIYVTLQPVEIVAQRQRTPETAFAAAPSGRNEL